jgi:hypothetical protein
VTEPCNCQQSIELQAELAAARVRISNLEYQNSNLRARLDAASPPLPPTTPPPADVMRTPAGRMATIEAMMLPTQVVDVDTGEARELPPIISIEAAAGLLMASPCHPDGAESCTVCGWGWF